VHVPNEVKDENLRPANSASAPPAAEIVHIPLDAIPQEADAAQPFVVQREFVFPGDLASVPESRQQVMQFVEEHCSSQGDQIDIPVALQEALANAALQVAATIRRKGFTALLRWMRRTSLSPFVILGRASILRWPIPIATPPPPLRMDAASALCGAS
jgi:hypothetical protein